MAAITTARAPVLDGPNPGGLVGKPIGKPIERTLPWWAKKGQVNIGGTFWHREKWEERVKKLTAIDLRRQIRAREAQPVKAQPRGRTNREKRLRSALGGLATAAMAAEATR